MIVLEKVIMTKFFMKKKVLEVLGTMPNLNLLKKILKKKINT